MSVRGQSRSNGGGVAETREDKQVLALTTEGGLFLELELQGQRGAPSAWSAAGAPGGEGQAEGQLAGEAGPGGPGQGRGCNLMENLKAGAQICAPGSWPATAGGIGRR